VPVRQVQRSEMLDLSRLDMGLDETGDHQPSVERDIADGVLCCIV
jgi:hypothetical protein